MFACQVDETFQCIGGGSLLKFALIFDSEPREMAGLVRVGVRVPTLAKISARGRLLRPRIECGAILYSKAPLSVRNQEGRCAVTSERRAYTP